MWLSLGPPRRLRSGKAFPRRRGRDRRQHVFQPRDGLGSRFPAYIIRDLVRAQHEFVTKGLGLTGLKAAAGPSMGSFQAVEWRVTFPRFAEGLVLIVPAGPRARGPGSACGKLEPGSLPPLIMQRATVASRCRLGSFGPRRPDRPVIGSRLLRAHGRGNGSRRGPRGIGRSRRRRCWGRRPKIPLVWSEGYSHSDDHAPIARRGYQQVANPRPGLEKERPGEVGDRPPRSHDVLLDRRTRTRGGIDLDSGAFAAVRDRGGEEDRRAPRGDLARIAEAHDRLEHVRIGCCGMPGGDGGVLGINRLARGGGDRVRADVHAGAAGVQDGLRLGGFAQAGRRRRKSLRSLGRRCGGGCRRLRWLRRPFGCRRLGLRVRRVPGSLWG